MKSVQDEGELMSIMWTPKVRLYAAPLAVS